MDPRFRRPTVSDGQVRRSHGNDLRRRNIRIPPERLAKLRPPRAANVSSLVTVTDTVTGGSSIAHTAANAIHAVSNNTTMATAMTLDLETGATRTTPVAPSTLANDSTITNTHDSSATAPASYPNTNTNNNAAKQAATNHTTYIPGQGNEEIVFVTVTVTVPSSTTTVTTITLPTTTTTGINSMSSFSGSLRPPPSEDAPLLSDTSAVTEPSKTKTSSTAHYSGGGAASGSNKSSTATKRSTATGTARSKATSLARTTAPKPTSTASTNHPLTASTKQTPTLAPSAEADSSGSGGLSPVATVLISLAVGAAAIALVGWGAVRLLRRRKQKLAARQQLAQQEEQRLMEGSVVHGGEGFI
ncbi:hypothetical protein B0T24DRAFT_594218 [Lasiosphaeria ovina]|uniref:Uncharacterized protein n=1 Tax=Lasiosphaeria ovina TaxID=92902 RepID=A0AAE0N8G7_9PEZI|nr:hypothetical protein B0T24DRAFT_594218 [Lasiosphaeria ovina]